MGIPGKLIVCSTGVLVETIGRHRGYLSLFVFQESFSRVIFLITTSNSDKIKAITFYLAFLTQSILQFLFHSWQKHTDIHVTNVRLHIKKATVVLK